MMTNHTHLIAIPEREDSLAVLLRRVHGRYAQFYNASAGRYGHLWQSRYFACALGGGHLWRALAYVETNPVRAGLVARAEHYQWSSAEAHVTGRDEYALVDMAWWRREGPGTAWSGTLNREDDAREEIERCTYAGRPFGDPEFVREVSKRFGRHWTRGRPARENPETVETSQGSLFVE